MPLILIYNSSCLAAVFAPSEKQVLYGESTQRNLIEIVANFVTFQLSELLPCGSNVCLKQGIFKPHEVSL